MDQHTPAGVGLLTVFAVSGTVAFIARFVHKRLVSDFMKKIELEFTGSGELCQVKKKKKKVRFAEDVIVRECRGSDCVSRRKTEDGYENREVLYKQILEYKTLIKP